MRALCTPEHGDFIGLTVAARAAKRKGLISSGASKLMERLDVAFHFNDHATESRCRSILGRLNRELAGSRPLVEVDEAQIEDVLDALAVAAPAPSAICGPLRAVAPPFSPGASAPWAPLEGHWQVVGASLKARPGVSEAAIAVVDFPTTVMNPFDPLGVGGDADVVAADPLHSAVANADNFRDAADTQAAPSDGEKLNTNEAQCEPCKADRSCGEDEPNTDAPTVGVRGYHGPPPEPAQRRPPRRKKKGRTSGDVDDDLLLDAAVRESDAVTLSLADLVLQRRCGPCGHKLQAGTARRCMDASCASPTSAGSAVTCISLQCPFGMCAPCFMRE